MLRLIWINITRRLTRESLLFVFLSLILIWCLAVYNADFLLTPYDFILSKKTILCEFVYETHEVIILIGIFLVVMFNVQEITTDADSFDSYFICHFSKTKCLLAKLISSLLILGCYVSLMYVGIITIYIIRFKEVIMIRNFMKILETNLLYFIFIYLLGFILITCFKNYYSLILILVVYWVAKMSFNTIVDGILKFIFLRVEFNYEMCYSYFDINYTYVFWYLIGIAFLVILLYRKKDLNC